MTAIPTLGRLERVPLRSVWSHEASSFTPWLAEANSLQFLADELGLPGLELIQTERVVSEFYCDIVARVSGTDQLVAIENQLEASDHKHLGQTLTYLAGTEASIAVWVSERLTDGHRAALEWLNRKTADDVAFFGVEVEAWRIGESVPAPKFNVVVRPNAWARELHSAARAEPSSQRSWAPFWEAFDEYAARAGVHRTGSPPKGTNYYVYLVPGKVGVVGYLAQSRGKMGVYLGAWRPDAELIAEAMERDRATLSDKLGKAFDIQLRGHTVWAVTAERAGDATSVDTWPELQQWLAEEMRLCRTVFEPWLADSGFLG